MKKNIKILSFVVPLFLLLGMVSCKSPKKIFHKSIAEGPFDAIIVPGSPFEDSIWSPLMKIRVHWANYLYKSGYTKNIIFTGGDVYTAYYESKIMGLYAQALNIPKENIFYENRAEHSTENVYYSRLIADSLGFNKVGLATDPFQSRMLKRFIRKRELNVFHIPIHFDTLETLDLITPTINSYNAYSPNFVSIRERESWFERWRGTRGKHIKWKE